MCRCSGVDTRRAPSFGGRPDVSAAAPAAVRERSALRGLRIVTGVPSHGRSLQERRPRVSLEPFHEIGIETQRGLPLDRPTRKTWSGVQPIENLWTKGRRRPIGRSTLACPHRPSRENPSAAHLPAAAVKLAERLSTGLAFLCCESNNVLCFRTGTVFGSR